MTRSSKGNGIIVAGLCMLIILVSCGEYEDDLSHLQIVNSSKTTIAFMTVTVDGERVYADSLGPYTAVSAGFTSENDGNLNVYVRFPDGTYVRKARKYSQGESVSIKITPEKKIELNGTIW